jgi:predicted solute-binding protein
MEFRRLTAIAALLALSAVACVADQHEAAMEARRAYRECLEAASGNRERCEHLQEEYHQRAEYEEDAAKAWGCKNTADRCDPRELRR